MRGRAMGMRAVARMLLVPLALTAAIAGCKRAQDDADVPPSAGWEPNTEGKVLALPLDQVRQAIQTHVQTDQSPPGIEDRQWKHVRQLYDTYDDSPLWFDADGLSDRARTLVHMLVDANSDGLSLSDYPLDTLRGRLSAVLDTRNPSSEQLARADMVLTATYVALAEDLLTGQVDPRSVSQGWHIDPRQVDVDSAVARTLRAGRFDQAMASLRPQDTAYDLLRTELERYRKIVAAGGWPSIPAGATLRSGDSASAERLGALRTRLTAEGYLPAGDGTPTGSYDRTLAGAVADFQAHHAIEVDSAVGPQTLSALNLPASYRAGQIAANLERFRWLPGSLGERYILVNVPAFRVQAFQDGEQALAMKVVVGAEYNDRSTPAFSDSMSLVVFRPYWNVPQTIAEREIYPKAAADPGYMASHNYEVVRQDGVNRVRQKPGNGNSLGLVKFLFPNDFAIYLHDTPESSLFQKDVRAASHGCIRLEHPAELAQWVLGWDAQKVQQAMHDGPDDHEVKVEPKIPVYIVYFTAYERDGGLWFGNDLYDRDRALVDRLTRDADSGAGALATATELQKLVGS